MNDVIEDITEANRLAALAEFSADLRKVRDGHRAAAKTAVEALGRIIANVLPHQGSSQSRYLRALLYSLWNGKPANLSDVLCLDWNIRADLCAVIAGFGYEGDDVKFFYDAMQAQIQAAGMWQWFLEERFEGEEAKPDRVQASRRRRRTTRV
jgi:hypothetical protein